MYSNNKQVTRYQNSADNIVFKPKIQTKDNTTFHKYQNIDPTDKQKQFVMCPAPGCTEHLIGAWSKYETGEIKDGLRLYKCPACGYEFTVNDFLINCIEVPDKDGIGVLYNVNSKKIVFKVNGVERFQDPEGDWNVYIPVKLISQNIKFFYLSGINYDDLLDEQEYNEKMKKVSSDEEREALEKEKEEKISDDDIIKLLSDRGML